ncbi:MAG: fibronectin type III domain-containing protein [Fibromonadaceae bacterium]|jgi:hypothetical protein|nr:fibronectin type III domain-containing protein [Fibromonadaceae bacterium]
MTKTKFLILATLLVGLFSTMAWGQAVVAYTISGGPDNFTVTRNGGPAFSQTSSGGNYAIVMDAIRNNAAGAPVEITFGGGSFRDENSSPGVFQFVNGGSTTWGTITLIGSVSIQDRNKPLIYVGDDITLESRLSMNSSHYNDGLILIHSVGTGLVTITSGTLNFGSQFGIRNAGAGTVTVTGGTFTGTGTAIDNTGTGTIILGGNPTISGRISTPANTVSVITDGNNAFAPSAGKTYTLNLTGTLADNDIAVIDGAVFHQTPSFFTVSNIGNRVLAPYLQKDLALRPSGTTAPTNLAGTISIDNADPRIGDVLTAEPNITTPSTIHGVYFYEWFVGGVSKQKSRSETYTVQVEDFNKPVLVQFTTNWETGSAAIVSTATELAKKKENLHQPELPEVEENGISFTSITLKTISGYEYRVDENAWQDSPEIVGLMPDTEYTFYQRQKETADTEYSLTSVGVTFSTLEADGDVLLGRVTINNNGANPAQIAPFVGNILSANLVDNDEVGLELKYQWQRGSINIEDATNSSYELTVFDAGSTIRVIISVDGRINTLTSSFTMAVSKVTLTGEIIVVNSTENNPPRIGETLTANYTGNGTEELGAFNYEWRAGSTVLKTGTENTYALTAADFGRRITVTVTSQDQNGSVVSNQIGPIADASGGTSIAYFVAFGNNDGEQITARRGSSTGTVISQNANATTVFNAIRSDAGGTDVNITINNGNIHTTIPFNNAGAETWGEITLAAATRAFGRGSISIGNGVSVISNLTITNMGWQEIVPFNNAGTLTIAGDSIANGNAHDANTGHSIVNTGTLILAGDPTIIGRIQTPTGVVRAADNFAPGATKTYRLNFQPAAGADQIAVHNGAPHVARFAATNMGSFSLVAHQGDIWVGTPLTGTASINNMVPRIGDALIASITGTTNASGTRTFVWKNGKGEILHTGETYTVQITDYEETLTVEVSTSNQLGILVSSSTAAVLKKVGPSAPVAPTVVSSATTNTSITLEENPGHEFSMDNGETWQTNNVFVDLESGTEYTFIQRVAETDDTEASEASPGVSETTTTLPFEGTASIVGNIAEPRVGETLKAVLNNGIPGITLSYVWKRYAAEDFDIGEVIESAESEEYTLTRDDFGHKITVTISAKGYSGDSESEQTKVVDWAILTGTATITGGTGPDGAPRIDDVLTASFEGNATIGFSYQWKVCDGVCANIGETSSTYTVTESNLGSKFMVVISATEHIGEKESDITEAVLKRLYVGDVVEPVAEEVTYNSVVLAEVDGYEYSRDNENWQLEAAFTGLMPGTEYTFYQRAKETDYTEASEVSSVAVRTKKLPFDEGSTIIITGNEPPRIGNVLTAVFTGSGADENIVVSYEWKAGGKIVGTDETYTITVDDFEKTITVSVSSDAREDVLTSDATEAVLKKVGPAAPAAPTVNTVSHNRVILDESDNYQYAIVLGDNIEAIPSVWQNTPEFTGLAAETDYVFFQRIAETNDTEASPASIGLLQRTGEAPDVTIEGEVILSGANLNEVRIGNKLEASIGGDTNVEADEELSYEWKRCNANGEDCESIIGFSDESYTLTIDDLGSTIRAVIRSDDKAGELVSNPTGVVLKKVAPTAPDAPELAGTATHNSVTLVAVEGYEYRVNNGEWTTNNVFEGLSPNTEYSFTQRIAETNDTYASGPSAGLSVTTLKNPAPDAPQAPTVEELTYNSVTLVAVEGYEYRVNNGEWTTNNVFEGLDPNTEYSFTQRIAETNDTYASEASGQLDVKTDPEPVIATINNESPRVGDVLGVLITGSNVAATSYVWKADGETVGTSATYTVASEDLGKTITVSVASDAFEVTSAATAAVQKRAAPPTPSAPMLASRTHNSVTLTPTQNVNYEYRMGDGAWQTSNVFENLDPETEYTFYRRVAGTEDTEASATSAGLSVTTLAHSTSVLPQIALGNISVKAVGYNIVLENLPSNAKVEVYNLKGERVHSATSQKIAVQAKGVYLVKINNQTIRVAVR